MATSFNRFFVLSSNQSSFNPKNSKFCRSLLNSTLEIPAASCADFFSPLPPSLSIFPKRLYIRSTNHDHAITIAED